jgi:Fic family protein
MQWIWQHPDWLAFSWQEATLQPLLREVYDRLGQLKGKSAAISNHQEFSLDALLANIVASSGIESEQIDVYAVRSSLARHLGLDEQHPVATTAQSEGLVLLMQDAVTQWSQPLTLEQLLQWHRWLFQGHHSLFRKIDPGTLRGDAPMQIVSGPIKKPRIHFEAPPRAQIESELEQFIGWFNASTATDPILRAGICHLWFVTLHPFEDGNGRITRALTDRALAQADQQGIRLYAMSETILARRTDYYRLLETTQKGTPEITDWLRWFLETLIAALDSTLTKIDRTLRKTRFWIKQEAHSFSPEQRKVLNRLLDGDFEQGISAKQYQSVAKVSKATATRHLSDLLSNGVLIKLPGGGRNTRYQIAEKNPHQQC